MSKFSIQMEGGSLDMYKQDISWEWTNIRFADGIKDQYSTDVDIPKTKNNMNLLGISGLLDSPSQLFGTHIQPCILGINGTMMDVYLQVVGITEDNITICLYERTLPDKVFGKKMREFMEDDWNTIWVWSVNTMTAYPQSFPTYNYGSSYMPNLAMKHPSRKLNDLIAEINSTLQDFTLPSVDDSLWLMAGQKYVCPQNTRQMIEFACTLQDDDFVFAGGQHVTNDLEGWDGHSKVLESTVKEITFNRSCTATIYGYVSWGRKSTTAGNTFRVTMFKNDDFVYSWQINTSLYGFRNGLVKNTQPFTVNINSGDVITLRVLSTTTNNPHNKFQLLCGVLDIEYSNYQITDDDYGNELVYCRRHPSLKQWFPDNTILEHPFDGRHEEFYIYNWDGSLNQSATFFMDFPWRGISYFGYWCNIGDITLKELYFGICWLYQRKPVREMAEMRLVPANDTTHLVNSFIEEIRPSSDMVGQVTDATWCGGEHPTTLTEIDSEWLEEKVTRHESPFVYVEQGGGGIAKINQYEITSSLSTDGETVWDCKFNEPEGAVLVKYGQYGRLNRWGLIPPPPISKMGINRVKQCMEVTIKSRDIGLSDVDYVYLDGRKFMVIEGDTDLNNNETTLTCLLLTTQYTHLEPVHI